MGGTTRHGDRLGGRATLYMGLNCPLYRPKLPPLLAERPRPTHQRPCICGWAALRVDFFDIRRKLALYMGLRCPLLT